MKEPENLTVHLLREIREDFRSLDKRIDRLDGKVDDGFAGVSKRLDSLQKALNGESLTFFDRFEALLHLPAI